MNLNNPKTLDEAIEIIKELCPEHEETNTGKAEAMVLCAVKDEELMGYQDATCAIMVCHAWNRRADNG